MTQHRALNVACPTCKARKGEPCRDIRRSRVPGRKRNLSSVHPARGKLARERFVEEKRLRAQLLPLLDGDKVEARKLAAAVCDQERRLDLRPTKPTPAYKKPPRPGENARASTKDGKPVGHHRRNGAKLAEGVTEDVYYRIRRFLVLRERYKRQHMRQMARALKKERAMKSDFAPTPELLRQFGLRQSRLAQQTRSSTIAQLHADGLISGEELEQAAEICEAHRLVAGDVLPKGMDPTNTGTGSGGKRWTVNDVSARELVFEVSYYEFRAAVGEQPLGMPLVRNIVIFEFSVPDLGKTLRVSEQDILVQLRAHLETWERIRKRNDTRTWRQMFKSENDRFFEEA